MKSLLRLLGVLISILYASSLYAQGSPNSTNSSAGTTTAGSISTPQTSASTTSGAAVSDGIPVGTTITNQNWDTYKAFMPEGMVSLFQEQYFWKMPADVQMEVGPSIIRPLPKN